MSCLNPGKFSRAALPHEANVMSKSRKIFSCGVAARDKCHLCCVRPQKHVLFWAHHYSRIPCVMALALVGPLQDSHHCTVSEWLPLQDRSHPSTSPEITPSCPHPHPHTSATSAAAFGVTLGRRSHHKQSIVGRRLPRVRTLTTRTTILRATLRWALLNFHSYSIERAPTGPASPHR